MAKLKITPIKIPPIVHGGGLVAMKPAGTKYVAARTNHPGYAPKPVITPKTAAQMIVNRTKGAGGNKATTKQTAGDTLQQITNRYISSLLTPQQQNAQAASSVDAQIKLALAGMRASTLAEQQQAAHQAERAQQYAMALGSMRDMSGAQTTADYTNAAHDIQGLGTGLTGTIADAQQAEANQAAQSIADRTQGLGQAKGLDVEGLKNIAQYTGVTMPATNLFEEAANQAGQARLSQDTRAAQIGNIAQDYLQKGTEAQQELQRQRTALEATRPSLYQSAISALQGGGRSDMATIISALALANQTAQTPAKNAKNTAEAGKATATGKASTVNAGVNVGKQTGIIMVNGKPTLAKDFYWATPGTTKASPVPKGQQIDWAKDPTGHTLKRNPFAYAPKSNATAKDQAKEIQRLLKAWAGKLDKDVDMKNSRYAKDISDPLFNEAPQWVPKMTYAKARADMIARLPPILRTNKQMLANINTSLARVGYKVPTKAKPATSKPATKPKPKKTGKDIAPILGTKGLFG